MKDSIASPALEGEPLIAEPQAVSVSLRLSRAPVAERSALESILPPDSLPPGIRFDYSLDEILTATSELTPGNYEDQMRVLRYAMVWSGIKVDDEILHWSTLDHGYREGTRLPRFTAPIDNKRLSLRLVPQSWEGVHSTPFRLTKNPEGGAHIVALSEDGKEHEVAKIHSRYVSESVQTLAYKINQKDGSTDITVNPQQRCIQNCEFCCRGYHDMNIEKKRELRNYNPLEMASALMQQFPDTDWEEVSGITLVTGDFRSAETALDYLEEFGRSMHRATSGLWNPKARAHQDLSLSTHLIKSDEAMHRARELGMKRFIHTVEMTDDDAREAVMHTGGDNQTASQLNKGHDGFLTSLDVLQRAISVFGAGQVEPVLVIGLDPLDQTKIALNQLKDIGIQRVSRGLVNVYNMNQFGLLRSDFFSAVQGMQYARDLFTSPHSRVVERPKWAN